MPQHYRTDFNFWGRFYKPYLYNPLNGWFVG